MNVINKEISFGEIEQVFQIENAIFGNSIKESIVKSLNSETSKYFISKCEGEVVAFCNLYIYDTEAEIINIAVKEEFRGFGISKQLFNFSLKKCSKVEVVFLEVKESNRVAINLYNSLGFEFSGRRKRYYSSNEDAIVMKKQRRK